jgi:hypothetical protein
LKLALTERFGQDISYDRTIDREFLPGHFER